MSKLLLTLNGPWRKTLRFGTELTEALVWPAQKQPRVIFFMIPGNPGLINFYNEFLSALHEKNKEHLEIIGVSHKGHSLFETETGHLNAPQKAYTLQDQVDHISQVFLYFHKLYSKSGKNPDIPKFVLCGHSVGSYIIQQVFVKHYMLVDKVYYLFPTVAHIRQTPNGDKLSALFHPVSIALVSWFAAFLRFMVPTNFIAAVINTYQKELPQDLTYMAANKLISRPTVSNFLNMAREEMAVIRDLNSDLYLNHGSKFVMYYGTSDGWAPLYQYDMMVNLESKSEIHLCKKSLSHSFVADGSIEMAEIVDEWLDRL